MSKASWSHVLGVSGIWELEAHSHSQYYGGYYPPAQENYCNSFYLETTKKDIALFVL